jgi:soluble lytic murein transglycosylase
MALFAWQKCKNIVAGSTYFENFLWYQSLTSIFNGDYQGAKGYFADLKKSFSKSPQGDKYAYFLAYSLKHNNEDKLGDELLRDLAKKPDLNYYVLLAQKTLGIKEPPGRIVAANAFSSLANISENSPGKNALFLYHLGFKSEARDFVLHSPGSAQDKLAVLQHMGLYHDVWRRSYLLRPRAKITSDGLDITSSIRSSHPMPYEPIMNEVCAKYGINKSLFYAIMQAESGFKEDAVSTRGASGLVQMMPFVAKDLASRIAVHQFSPEQLKNPRIALNLGGLLVASLVQQFHNPYLVLAAYNAGAHQVQKWLDLFGHLPPELFVERIPFKQTKDYIKNILPNESLYYGMTGKPIRLLL